MVNQQLKELLFDINTPSRINRNKAANIVWDNPILFNDLINMVFEVDNKQSVKAAWVLERICIDKGLTILLPYIDFFTQHIAELHFDSAVRSCAKICEQMAIAYTSEQTNEVKNKLKQTHIETIVETGFDWLITPQKTAVKAYTMQTLYLFGLQKSWIHPELEYLISTQVIHQSKGCTARGKKILHLITKQQKKSF
ncbi:adenylosuccinate lyase [Tenacibaculum sp. UWU-22]|uniref:adenylosuccinate lyase n=1 Tax=Tenacibaculum sp. UWU-22 TaxID=3234187 RepID=UPI0034DAC05E